MISGKLVHRTEIDDARWDRFIDGSPQYSIYCKSWYLDSTCSRWMAVIVSRDNEWISIMPIHVSSKWSVKYSIQPCFTQYLGILFHSSAQSTHVRLELEKKAINITLKLLPSDLKVISYNFSPALQYFLPFYWNGFQVSPRLSYQLKLEKDMEQLTAEYSSRIKDHIRKAQKHHLSCIMEDSAEQLICICNENELMNEKTAGVFRKLWAQLVSRGIAFCLYAKDKDGNVHCGGAFIRDREKLIFLSLSTRKEYKKFGSTALLIHESIRIAHKQSYSYFDFEGSMLEPVEYFFKGFNPSPLIYFNVKKNRMGHLFPLYQRIRQYFKL